MKKWISLLAALVLCSVAVFSQCTFHPYSPTVVASGSFLSQTSCSGISSTTLYTPSADGDFSVVLTSEDLGTSFVDQNVNWTDNAGSHTATVANTGSGTGYTFLSGADIHVLSGDAITFTTTVTCSGGNTVSYNVYYKVVQY